MHLLEIKNITKKYDKRGQLALNGVSLSISEGEIVSLLGVNGAGKTTLSSIVATLRPPTSGDILFKGASIYKDLTSYRMALGFCPQKPNLNDFLTLRQNLEFSGRYYGMDENAIAQRIDQLAKQFEFAQYLDQKPTVLSGGYKQRFTFARSILHNPKLVVLDEPTVALDPHIRRQLWEYIKKLKQEKIAVLLTTHYLDEAEILSDRVCVLDQGKVKLIDTPSNLMSSFQKGRLEEVFIHLISEQKD